jgi:hypothetical protein
VWFWAIERFHPLCECFLCLFLVLCPHQVLTTIDREDDFVVNDWAVVWSLEMATRSTAKVATQTTLMVQPYIDAGVARTDLENGRLYFFIVRLTNALGESTIAASNGAFVSNEEFLPCLIARFFVSVRLIVHLPITSTHFATRRRHAAAGATWSRRGLRWPQSRRGCGQAGVAHALFRIVV